MKIDRENNIINFPAAFIIALLILSTSLVQAGSATWKIDPDTGDWNNPSNWSTGGPPNGAADVATFHFSNILNVFLTANTELDRIVFAGGANLYSILPHPGSGLTFSGAGIVNDSNAPQAFTTYVEGLDRFLSSYIRFTNSASAGRFTVFTNASALDGIVTGRGSLEFLDSSSASNATITNLGGRNSGASTDFYNSSTAASARITNRSAVSEGFGGSTIFHDTSNAGHATIMNTASGTDLTVAGFTEFHDLSSAAHALIFVEGTPVHGFTTSAVVRFLDHSTAANSIIVTSGAAAGAPAATTTFLGESTAGNAVLIASGDQTGGRIVFGENSTGGTARVELFDHGALSVGHSLTIGSIEGDGLAFIGSGTLSVGSNHMSTEFSGVINDFGVGGSLTKIGIGALTLSGANTYVGATTVNAGKLIINGSITSAVTVNGGVLGGEGTTGSVTVNSGGTLAPGSSPGILHVAGNLTLTLGSTYLVDINGTAVGSEYDQTAVTGAVILGAATLSLNLGFTAADGDLFTIIANDGSDPVIGIFEGLIEGATFMADGQTFAISYLAGDGNDVALTAMVPEPGTWLLLSLGAVLLLGLKRRSGVAARN